MMTMANRLPLNLKFIYLYFNILFYILSHLFSIYKLISLYNLTRFYKPFILNLFILILFILIFKT